ncbi:hypothetical protein AMR42_14920 [Limnothrix sp. PR1529]|uniref:AAA family ATPase n=1 Tax=Limnothrix sp. PR1529 TaxID=1704291 RepID=UPI00081E7201|nr:NB-ARC domain-containing protein [Limnothrix sp. PR1529]OCQ93579.1 hypothetical protein BCR12_09305 [Limnothrix sp. P13C2]PIB06417.1 hypothetical protein AMR42_14920 [Limnothrix sp. PR1529]
MDSKSTLFQEVGCEWNLEGLYRDLGRVKARLLWAKQGQPCPEFPAAGDPRRSQLSRTERLYLRGFLTGMSIKALATVLEINTDALRTELTNKLYTYLKALLNWEGRFCHRRALAMLAERPYRISSAPIAEHQNLKVYLPAQDSAILEGRDREWEHLIHWLQRNQEERFWVIEGAGGTGKTALALASVHYLIQQNSCPFQRVLFTSAKTHYLTGMGLLPGCRSQQTLEQLLSEILQNLTSDSDRVANEWNDRPLPDRMRQAWTLMAQQPMLLILDSFEETTDPQATLAFLYELPATVKVLFTCRYRLPIARSLHLDPLEPEAALRWVMQRVSEAGWPWSLGQYRRLVAAAGSLPGPIAWGLGQLAAGQPIAWVIAQLEQPDHWVTQFYCANTLEALGGQLAGQFLLALSWFAVPVQPALLAQVAGVDPEAHATWAHLAKLAEQSMVTLHCDGRYGLSSLARRYVATVGVDRLAPTQEMAMRERWLQWAIDYVRQHGQGDRLEWLTDHQAIDLHWDTLNQVLDWCLAAGRLESFWQVFQPLRGYSHFRGHWSERIARDAKAIQLARQQQNSALEARFLFDRGWTHALRNDSQSLRQACADFEAVWQLRDHLDLDLQSDLAINQLRLAYEQGSIDHGDRWKHRVEQLIHNPQLNTEHRLRLECQSLYYEGDVAQQAQNSAEALRLYTTALKKAQALGWQRGTAYIQSSIGQVRMAQGQYSRALRELEASYRLAAVIVDQRCCAYCCKHLARAALAGRLRKESRNWAERAIDHFQTLGMVTEAQEMEDFLKNL